MPKYNPDYFKEKFPHLFKEIKNRSETVEIESIRTSSDEGKKATKEDSRPNIIDFLRLCDTEDEALEIINHMEKESKIKPSYAKKLRQQLTHKGLRSFGSKRKPGEYSFIEQKSE
ncbi:hypothetical protein AKJ37_01385 [candidate division MSBL1 archaeon SCGC-AAA259I09]|uniref:DUF2095 domain-containing protein n=2 Tax=candidate division MSBL1 TaxID=215777 RepID=A0A133UV70_9EURY|nr:hypothetical protein AKJ62_00520 [candidate division MSBL1 archaeon SCGC-AAA259D14]KXA98087.1 hypothetical protein AKJ37_01385 [candidate division MSBL1 archaeon SCGC-AAA259I09]